MSYRLKRISLLLARKLSLLFACVRIIASADQRPVDPRLEDSIMNLILQNGRSTSSFQFHPSFHAFFREEHGTDKHLPRES